MVSARASSTAGPSARPTPVEMIPCTQSTFSCCTSRLKRSIVSLGEDSSSITSSILRPAMPPWALNFSVAHWLARIPFSPGAAAMPERGARTPMRTGLFCAMAGAETSPDAASALAAAADLSSVRREMAMDVLPATSHRGPFLCLPRHVSDKQRLRAAPSHSALLGLADESRYLFGAERPVVVEIGDDRLHERLGEADRPLLVAQVLVEDRQRELLRAFALIGPFEAIPGEALDVIMLVELPAVDRHDQPIDGALSF